MSDLRDTVLGALSPKEHKGWSEEGALDILSRADKPSFEDVEAALCEAISDIEEDSRTAWRHISRIIALSIQLHLPGSSDTRRVVCLLEARNLSEGSGGDADFLLAVLHRDLDYISKQKKSARRRSLLGSSTQALDYLQQFFSENFVKELALVGNVREASARRWIDGGGMSPESYGRVLLWARAFYAIAENNRDPLRWWQESLPTGNSPRDHFQGGWTGSPPAELQIEFSRLEEELIS